MIIGNNVAVRSNDCPQKLAEGDIRRRAIIERADAAPGFESGTEAGFAQDIQLHFVRALSGVPVEGDADRKGSTRPS